MPGRGTAPGPALYPGCGSMDGVRQHKREKTRTCAGCRAVVRSEMARYRVQRIVQGPRLLPTLGMRRRVRALARRGWSQDDIAGRLGMDPIRFKKIVQQGETRREVVEKVRAVYQELAWQDGPNDWARRNAERQGWPGPMDWDDPDNPEEIPLCEIERAHAEAKALDRLWRKNVARRAEREQRRQAPGLRLIEGGRQSGGRENVLAQQKAAMAT